MVSYHPYLHLLLWSILYSLDFFGFFTEIIMLVLLALLPFAAMCINAIVCALGNVDSVGSFTLCCNVHHCNCVHTW